MYSITITQKQFDELNKSLSGIFEVEYVHIEAGETHLECVNSGFGGKTIGTTGYKFTEEQRNNISISLKGKFIRFGKKHSEETKRKISESKKGIKLSEETKKKMSLSQSGRKLKPETIEKILQKRKGKPAGMKGKKKQTTTCPHCNLVGAKSSLKGYHFEKCKNYLNPNSLSVQI